MRSLLLLLLLTAAIAQAAVSPEKIENVRRLLRDGKVAAAESAANALIAANPAEAEAYALLASVSVAKGDPDAAIAAAEKAAELAPASGDYQRQLGDAYGFAAQKAGMLSKMGLAKKCGAAYEKAVALDPANLDARSSLLGYYQNAPSMMGGGMDKAHAQAAEIRKLDANRGRLAYATLYAADKKFAEAFTQLEEALKATPENYAALYQFGRLAAITGERIDRGLEALKQCLTLPPPPNTPGHAAAQWRIGNLLEKKNDPAGARTAYEAALKFDPKFTQAADSLKKLK